MVSKIKLLASVSIFTVAVIFSYYRGYYVAELEKTQEIENLKLVHQHELTALLNRMRSLQDQLYETERAWLEQEDTIKTEYKVKKEQVIKTVVKYVQDNNLSKCRIGTSGMQRINEAILTSVHTEPNKDK